MNPDYESLRREMEAESALPSDPNITPVVFVRLEGVLVAVFPLEPTSYQTPDECQSYATIGQHSGANAPYMATLQIVTSADQYQRLYSELTLLGYRLKIYTAFTPEMKRVRREAWRKMLNSK